MSTFDIVEEKWSQHVKYEERVKSLFRTERWNGKKWVKVTASLLENGEIHYDAFKTTGAKTIEVGGEIQEIEIDSQNNMIAYIIVKTNS